MKEFEEIGIHGLNMFGAVVKGIPTKTAIDLIKQLDEPEKVKVPQFVDDVIEGAREQSPELEDALHYTWGNGTKEFTEWYNKKSNRDLFALAWILGYEVEAEKRYKVVMPNISSSGGALTRIKHDDSWIWIDTLGTIVEGRTHTRKEPEEADFGWVFDCPGIEIEEVVG